MTIQDITRDIGEVMGLVFIDELEGLKSANGMVNAG